ncbi:hypothetical protein OH77DRAFT_1420202 [Trametes cingulata]|nr:hypothetical protein OH77DRAFT_1420202 [Trametes cingulata]
MSPHGVRYTEFLHVWLGANILLGCLVDWKVRQSSLREDPRRGESQRTERTMVAGTPVFQHYNRERRIRRTSQYGDQIARL